MASLSDPECWKIDTESSTLAFKVRHALLGQVGGEFRCWGGRVLVDRDDPDRCSVRLWVDLSSIDTGSQQRNQHILETDLFDVRWEPALVFDGGRLEADAAGGAVVVGLLTLHSYRREIAVSIDPAPLRGASGGAPRFALTARASIDRAAFGLRWRGGVHDWLSDRLVGDNVDITAHVEAARDERAIRDGASAPHFGALAQSARAQALMI